MSERTIGSQQQTEVAVQPAIHEVFRIAAKKGHSGKEVIDGRDSWNEFVGIHEGSEFKIQARWLAIGETVRIVGPGANAVITRYDEMEQSTAEQYSITGEVPADILEILSKLKPQN